VADHVRKVKRRGKTRLVIDIPYKGPDGKALRYRRDAEVQTKAGAEAELRRRLAALAATGDPCAILDAQGRPVVAASPKSDACRMTFAELAKRYFAEYAPSQLKYSTRFTYEHSVNLHLIPRFGKMPVHEIDGAAVRLFDADLAKRGFSETRRRRLCIILRSMLRRFAVEAKILSEPPVFPKLHPKKKTIVTALTREQSIAVVQAAPKHQLGLTIAIYTGLRPGEIRGLLWRDVDFAANQLVVREAVVWGVRDKPKSGHERRIPLVTELREMLEAEFLRRKPKILDAVVLNARGKPLGNQTLGLAFKRAAKRAGLHGQWRLYDCRHFFVTELFRLGVGGPTVQKLAGHANLATTEIYAHVARVELEDAIFRLDKGGNGVVTRRKPE
jgi:integrase